MLGQFAGRRALQVLYLAGDIKTLIFCNDISVSRSDVILAQCSSTVPMLFAHSLWCAAKFYGLCKQTDLFILEQT